MIECYGRGTFGMVLTGLVADAFANLLSIEKGVRYPIEAI